MHRARILVVDDDAEIRRAWHRVLASAGYELRDADSFRAAQRIIRNWDRDPCDLVLLDLLLGDGHGADLLPVIDALEPKPAVAILSGHLDDEGALELCGCRAVCLSKPIAAATLVKAAGVLLRGETSAAFMRAYARHVELSPRETDVLLAIAIDGGLERTAKQLGLRSTTVMSYWRRIARKTHCRSQQDVLARILDFGREPTEIRETPT